MTIDLHSLMAPYALDALDADERATYEVHLEQCDDCRSELAGFLETSSRLGELEEVAPPPAMRAEVLAAARRTAQQRPVTVLAPRRLRHRVPQLVAAAAVALALAGGTATVVEHQRASDLQASGDKMTSVLTASDVRTSSEKATEGGTLRVMSSKSHDAAVVVGSALPQLDDDQVYQVWAMHDGTPRPAGLIGAKPGMVYVSKVAGADAFAVTVEPKGGSERPTTDPLAVTPVTA